MTEPAAASLEPAWWLVRVPEVFAEFAQSIAPSSVAKDGEGDYRRVVATGSDFPILPGVRMFCRWQMPVHHAWPCNPEKTTGFIEKAAAAIAGKFSTHHPKALLIGSFEPHAKHGYFRKLASNLRGRALQCMPGAAAGVDLLEPDDPVVHVLVGRTGLFCGLQTPRQANGFHPGGTRFIRQSGGEVLSRAGAKIVEALHHMRMFGTPPEHGAHWLELGACPGGMTSELLRHGYRVTAIDRAPLAAALDRADGLEFFLADVSRWKPSAGRRFDALLCDMNGPASDAFAQVARLAPSLQAGAMIVFTLKTAGAEGVGEMIQMEHHIRSAAASAGIRHLQTTHLTYNRREFTMFLDRAT
jgi:23S rRNA (cytidine2498-2'-O)-methyltransferase